MKRLMIVEHNSNTDCACNTNESNPTVSQKANMEAIQQLIAEKQDEMIKHYKYLEHYSELLKLPRDKSLYHEVDQTRRHGRTPADFVKKLIEDEMVEISKCEKRILELCMSI